jgi:hypothetical protein
MSAGRTLTVTEIQWIDDEDSRVWCRLLSTVPIVGCTLGNTIDSHSGIDLSITIDKLRVFI